MNLMLLGNGFDLHYKLPTQYQNFLHVVAFLTENYDASMTTVGSVFGNKELQKQDRFIADSYATYRFAYDHVLLDTEIIKEMIEIARKNVWFRYFLGAFNQNIGWIDFEKEIAKVCGVFERLFQSPMDQDGENICSYEIFPGGLDKTDQYILTNFFDCFGQVSSRIVYYAKSQEEKRFYDISSEYYVETVNGSGRKIINKEKVVQKLSDSLEEFSDILNMYLRCFSDNTCKLLIRKNTIAPLITGIDIAITFNYTRTFEYLYQQEAVHIHGDIHGPIVLGLNPDQKDELETMDTTFIRIKKYFQRVLYRTDIGYLQFLNEWYPLGDITENPYAHLIVMGHSLDVTDSDVIRDLFTIAGKITIMCHNADAVKSYIPNLIQIFGKTEFDRLRLRKNLRFLMTDSEIEKIED